MRRYKGNCERCWLGSFSKCSHLYQFFCTSITIHAWSFVAAFVSLSAFVCIRRRMWFCCGWDCEQDWWGSFLLFFSQVQVHLYSNDRITARQPTVDNANSSDSYCTNNEANWHAGMRKSIPNTQYPYSRLGWFGWCHCRLCFASTVLYVRTLSLCRTAVHWLCIELLQQWPNTPTSQSIFSKFPSAFVSSSIWNAKFNVL